MWLLMKICFFGYMIIKLVWHCLLLCILFQKKVTHLWGTLLCPFSSKMGYKLGYIVKLHTFETSVYFFSCLYSNKEYKIHVKRWMELLFWEDIFIYLTSFRPKDIPGGLVVKNPPAHTGDVGSIPGLGRSPEKEMATHSNILTWEIPWTEEPGGPQTMGWQKVGRDWVTNAFAFRFFLVFEFVTPYHKEGQHHKSWQGYLWGILV